MGEGEIMRIVIGVLLAMIVLVGMPDVAMTQYPVENSHVVCAITYAPRYIPESCTYAWQSPIGDYTGVFAYVWWRGQQHPSEVLFLGYGTVDYIEYIDDRVNVYYWRTFGGYSTYAFQFYSLYLPIVAKGSEK